MTDIKSGIYRHYKGNEYEVLGVATHSETGEELVVYRALSDRKLFVRPKEMFLENVEFEGYKGPRFKLIKENSLFVDL